MANRQRWVLLGLAAVVVVVAVIVAGTGGGDDSGIIDTRTQTTGASPTSTHAGAAADTTIVIRDGKPVGGVRQLRFRKGSDVVFVVRSDADYEIHFHGYDIAKDVKAGGSVRYAVPAELDGRFEVEIEDTGTQIAEIEVVP
jgi:hypothetical protein